MYKKIIGFLAIIFSIFFPATIFAQQDFNNFKTLVSVGAIPKDFSSLTYMKIDEDLKEQKGDLSKAKERIFLQGIHYGIDEILHSGMVCYGDEVSHYIENVIDKLLADDPFLRSKLRFYTIKSTESNAFSTDQGIVFVTTGLISQLTNEAQLALVLAHEISHYTEKHVVASFEYKIENRASGRNIRDLSIYSKDHEIEADVLGLKWYHKAGYSKDEILPTFDVMMYSYLPFDEIEFPRAYFNTENMYVPASVFPTKKYEIKAVEDYDDSQSSHPNIKKRKEQIGGQIGNYSGWGNQTFTLGQPKFEYIRNICRFESVRTDIINAKYANALYSIFMLEKEYPNSLFLKRMKAQSWLGLVQFKKIGSIDETVDNTEDFEGEIAAVHYFIKKLSKDGMLTLALRQIYDLKKTFPNDIQLNAIYDRLLKELATTKNYKLEMFSKNNFHSAANNFTETLNKPDLVDSSLVKKSTSKYDKIKNKKNSDNPENFDSTKFYLYGIPDIIADTLFLSQFKQNKEAAELEIKKSEELDSLPYRERNKILKERKLLELCIGVEDLIVVEPMVFSYRNGKIDLVKSEKLKHDYSLAINNSAIDLGLTVYEIDRDNLASKGTEIFNERSTLFNFMTQLTKEDNLTVFPVDFESLETIKTNYGTSKVMFSWVEHEYDVNINAGTVLVGLLFYPILSLYIPSKILKGNSTEMNVIILDLEKGNVEIGTNYYFTDSPKKLHLGAHMYNIMGKLKEKK